LFVEATKARNKKKILKTVIGGGVSRGPGDQPKRAGNSRVVPARRLGQWKIIKNPGTPRVRGRSWFSKGVLKRKFPCKIADDNKGKSERLKRPPKQSARGRPLNQTAYMLETPMEGQRGGVETCNQGFKSGIEKGNSVKESEQGNSKKAVKGGGRASMGKSKDPSTSQFYQKRRS